MIRIDERWRRKVRSQNDLQVHDECSSKFLQRNAQAGKLVKRDGSVYKLAVNRCGNGAAQLARPGLILGRQHSVHREEPPAILSMLQQSNFQV